MINDDLTKLYWDHAQHWLSDDEFDNRIQEIADKHRVSVEEAAEIYYQQVWPEQQN